ncbi:LysM peptidoglycan-binding domain-containing protein [Apibacter adventoris]|uniref:LysM domain-containing protein n=1 Tax=Apibacter adventoris TaxID=1679466 RepID=A0A2S8ACH0_9FLAO|nr:LysM domain-containing protein [Apibacter adventoris]PQL92354.1 hypothetical protein C4S77_06695 [Apibacter adventoris]
MKKYHIQKGDTLESIAHSFGISVFELRDFHNTHCELSQLLGDKLTSHIKEILYQTKEDGIQKDFSELKEKESFELVLNPDASVESYGVQISFFENEVENSLKYNLKLRWLQRNLVKIQREKLYINNEESNLMADELAHAISSVLYPLELKVNSAGEITDINNYPEIVQRWKESLPKLQKYYKGEQTEKYIRKNEHVLSNPDLLFRSLTNDWFLHAFFNGLYHKYDLKKEMKIPRTFPMIPFLNPVEYIVTPRISTLEEDGEKLIQITLEGKTSDPRSRFDFENESYFPTRDPEDSEIPPARGTYKAKYFLTPDYYTLDGFYLECTLELEKTKKVYVTSSRIKKQSQLIIEEGIIEIVKPKEKKNSFLYD